MENRYVVAGVGIVIGVVIGFVIGFLSIAQARASEIDALTVNADTLRQSNLELLGQVQQLGSLQDDSKLLEAESVSYTHLTLATILLV